MDEKEFQEIKGRSEEIKRFLGRGSYVQTLNDDVPKLVAEVEELRAEPERLRGIIQSLKEVCSVSITESNEYLREMEVIKAAVREVLEDVRGIFDSFNKRESIGQLDQALSFSTVGHSDGRQAMNGNGAGDDSFQPSNGRSTGGLSFQWFGECESSEGDSRSRRHGPSRA